jgi:peroxiredoxin
MRQIGEQASSFSLRGLAGADVRLPADKPALLVFFETDCPTCRLTFPYLNRLARELGAAAEIIGISQDDEPVTREFAAQMEVVFPSRSITA